MKPIFEIIYFFPHQYNKIKIYHTCALAGPLVKVSYIDIVCSNWVNFREKCQSLVVLEIQRVLKASIFSLKFKS